MTARTTVSFENIDVLTFLYYRVMSDIYQKSVNTLCQYSIRVLLLSKVKIYVKKTCKTICGMGVKNSMSV